MHMQKFIDENLITLGRNIDTVLKYRQMSEPELARLSGVGQKTVNNIIKARHPANISNIAKIASVLRVDVCRLLRPDMTLEALIDERLDTVIDGFLNADTAAQEYIYSIAKRELP